MSRRGCRPIILRNSLTSCLQFLKLVPYVAGRSLVGMPALLFLWPCFVIVLLTFACQAQQSISYADVCSSNRALIFSASLTVNGQLQTSAYALMRRAPNASHRLVAVVITTENSFQVSQRAALLCQERMFPHKFRATASQLVRYSSCKENLLLTTVIQSGVGRPCRQCFHNGEVRKCRTCNFDYFPIKSGDVLACCRPPDCALVQFYLTSFFSR